MSTKSWSTSDRSRHYGSNGGKSTAKTTKMTYRIEGEYVTYAQIGERVGCSENRAGKRVRALIAANKPLTWENLK